MVKDWLVIISFALIVVGMWLSFEGAFPSKSFKNHKRATGIGLVMSLAGFVIIMAII